MLFYEIPANILKIYFETFSGEEIRNYEGDLVGYFEKGSEVDALIPSEFVEDYCEKVWSLKDITNILLKNGRLYITCDLCEGKTYYVIDQWVSDPSSGNSVCGRTIRETVDCECDGGGYYLNFG